MKPFFTRTMARIHAEQGHYHKAAEIYRFLRVREPEAQDLQDALQHVEALAAQNADARHARLVDLMSEWFHLLITVDRIERMRRLKNERRTLKP